jgi:hypothetical protein
LTNASHCVGAAVSVLIGPSTQGKNGMLTTNALLAAYLLANLTCVAALAVASLFMTRKPEGPRVVGRITGSEKDEAPGRRRGSRVGFALPRFDEVRRVDKIPTLGSGKTDYKLLRSQV